MKQLEEEHDDNKFELGLFHDNDRSVQLESD